MQNIRSCFLIFFVSIAFMCTVFGQIQFKRPPDKGRLLDNPQTFAVRRDNLVDLIKKTLRDLEIPVDEEKSDEKMGTISTKTVIFTKGGRTAENLEYVAKRPAGEVRNWLRGRYSLQLEVSPIDSQRTKLFVFAKIEGECQDESGVKWVECTSRGVKENDVIKVLIKRISEGN